MPHALAFSSLKAALCKQILNMNFNEKLFGISMISNCVAVSNEATKKYRDSHGRPAIFTNR